MKKKYPPLVVTTLVVPFTTEKGLKPLIQNLKTGARQ